MDRFDRDGRRFVVAHVNADSQVDPRALSPTERRVARRLVRGDSQKVIAYELGVAPRTVDNHVLNIGRKLGTSSQWETTALLTTLLHHPEKQLTVEGVQLRVWSKPSQKTPVNFTESVTDERSLTPKPNYRSSHSVSGKRSRRVSQSSRTESRSCLVFAMRR
ncbi:MAG: helix-turn-helix transcriptional regulator [Polyangiaceae bacterium]